MEKQPPAKVQKMAESEEEKVMEALEKRLEIHDNNRMTIQNKLHKICEGLHAQIDEMESRINKELEEKFTPEDTRLQAALNELRKNSTPGALQKARAELLIFQLYELTERKVPKLDLATLYELKTDRRINLGWTEREKPTNVCVTHMNDGSIPVGFTYLNPDEERVLSDRSIVAEKLGYKCKVFKKSSEQENKEYPLHKKGCDSTFTLILDVLEAGTTYGIRVKMVVGGVESVWSDEIAEFTTPEFKECCVWKKCPDYFDGDMKYRVDEGNHRAATKIGDDGWCTIIGDTSIPLNKVTSWDIKILESKDNDGDRILIGMAPYDINQNDYNYFKCGWYFDCYFSALASGPPYKYKYKEYGPRKGNGQYVHTGDSVGVVMDTSKGELSFALNGVNLGVAYRWIPLDKPLVPCVLLEKKGDSVELDVK